jgi:aminoglycoside phosphotransferase (APT) family kinase protein
MNLLAELVDIDLPVAPPGKVCLEGSELPSQFSVVRPASKLTQQSSL